MTLVNCHRAWAAFAVALVLAGAGLVPVRLEAASVRGSMRVTAEVVHSCEVATLASGVRVSCAAADRPTVRALGTTASGADATVFVAPAGELFAVFAEREPVERGSGPSDAAPGDPVMAVVVEVRL
jgi:hypothetical protein